jgi:hypothetical protein
VLNFTKTNLILLPRKKNKDVGTKFNILSKYFPSYFFLFFILVPLFFSIFILFQNLILFILVLEFEKNKLSKKQQMREKFDN